MSEHDDDGSADTLPLLLPPPPPPQPAARSASVTVTPISAASEMRFLTSPPRSLNVIRASTDAGSAWRGAQVSGQSTQHCKFVRTEQKAGLRSGSSRRS